MRYQLKIAAAAFLVLATSASAATTAPLVVENGKPASAKNASAVTVTRISTSSDGSSYKKAWDGSVTIAGGRKHTFRVEIEGYSPGAVKAVRVDYATNGQPNFKVCSSLKAEMYCEIK